MADVMDEKWCCLTCYSRFRFGEIIGSDILRCPKCNDGNLHPATGEVIEAREDYQGERGSLQ